MSQIMPAGGRLMQSLQSSISPATKSLFANTPLVQQNQDSTAQVITNTNPTVADPPTTEPDETKKIEIFEDVLRQVESGEVTADSNAVAVPADPLSTAADPLAVSSPQQTIVSALDPDAIYQPSEDSGIFAQAIPTAVDQAQQALDQQALQQIPQAGGRQKEHLEGGTVTAAAEMVGEIQYVEEEKPPEIPPEVESYIQHIEEAAKIEPQEIVVAQDAIPDTIGVPAPPRIVKVLPITKEQEEVGKRKNTSFSIRWLVEFGRKLAKALVGQAVYRQD